MERWQSSACISLVRCWHKKIVSNFQEFPNQQSILILTDCKYENLYFSPIIRQMLLLLLRSRFSRVRLCDPIDGSPRGSPIPGILQARTGVGCHFLFQCMKVKSESEVVSDSLRPHGLQPTRHPEMSCSMAESFAEDTISMPRSFFSLASAALS